VNCSKFQHTLFSIPLWGRAENTDPVRVRFTIQLGHVHKIAAKHCQPQKCTELHIAGLTYPDRHDTPTGASESSTLKLEINVVP